MISADRHHDCDFLLDQNLVANFETRYQHLLPEHCATFLGLNMLYCNQNMLNCIHVRQSERDQ